MSEITVFFGAGSESVYGLSGGKDFASNVLGINTESMNDAIKKHYSNREMDKWCPRYIEKSWEEKDLLSAAIKKAVLDEKDEFDKKKDYDEQVQARVNDFIQKGDYSIIEKYPSYMGILDEKFHALIAPKALGPQKFWSVTACYTRAYLSIVKEILDFNEDNSESLTAWYEEILATPKETMERIRKVGNTDERFKRHNYYDLLRDRPDIFVATSNYTPFCEMISKKTSDQIAYVNGRLGLFESPYEWYVYDVEKDTLPTDRVLFPYLFVQSGVKPIVEKTQIQELSKMLRAIDKSKKIVIVGYRVNADDNHLNGIFRSSIVQGKEVIYLDFENDKSDIISKRLHLDNSNSHFKWKSINRDTCLDIFKAAIES